MDFLLVILDSREVFANYFFTEDNSSIQRCPTKSTPCSATTACRAREAKALFGDVDDITASSAAVKADTSSGSTNVPCLPSFRISAVPPGHAVATTGKPTARASRRTLG